MEAHAIARYQRVSARKIGRILDLIRNKDVPVALNTLRFLNKPTKMPVLKTLQSAVANAMVKAGKAKLDEADLVVVGATAGGGPVMKRWRAGSKGTPAMYRHRTSHVRITVKAKEKALAAAAGSEAKKQGRS
jgi:large subunit ribosomal protein L22